MHKVQSHSHSQRLEYSVVFTSREPQLFSLRLLWHYSQEVAVNSLKNSREGDVHLLLHGFAPSFSVQAFYHMAHLDASW